MSELASPIKRGTREFRRTSLALFAGGFATFTLLYCVQSLLPLFADSFRVNPATSSLALSFTTGALAVTILFAGTLAERLGRKRVMTWSLTSSALLTLACAGTTDFTQLLALRLLAGATLSGLPAILMAYIGEEIAPESVGYAMGLSISGNALGGMMGRVLAGVLADWVGWRSALGLLGLACLFGAWLFWLFLPESRHFTPHKTPFLRQFTAMGGHFKDAGLLLLYLLIFLSMGSFVALYNYLAFRLVAPPFDLDQAWVGALFTVYVVGIVTSTWMGSLADRFGRRRILWIAVAAMMVGAGLTASGRLVVIIAGVALVTGGYFGAHAVASSWVTRRAQFARAQASSLYMFFSYMGASVVGTVGGVIFLSQGWAGLVALMLVLQGIALAIALRLALLRPVAETA